MSPRARAVQRALDEDYGKLSKRSLERSPARARERPYKRPDGFRVVEAIQARRAAWPSPAGINTRRPAGTPSAGNVVETFGETFDIHGGGIDLVFPTTRTRSRNRAARSIRR